MSWVLVAVAVWLVLAVGVALLVGRGIRLADQKAAEEYAPNFVVDASPVPPPSATAGSPPAPREAPEHEPASFPWRTGTF